MESRPTAQLPPVCRAPQSVSAVTTGLSYVELPVSLVRKCPNPSPNGLLANPLAVPKGSRAASVELTSGVYSVSC